jgi:hypothetical protein
VLEHEVPLIEPMMLLSFLAFNHALGRAYFFYFLIERGKRAIREGLDVHIRMTLLSVLICVKIAGVSRFSGKINAWSKEKERFFFFFIWDECKESYDNKIALCSYSSTLLR